MASGAASAGGDEGSYPDAIEPWRKAPAYADLPPPIATRMIGLAGDRPYLPRGDRRGIGAVDRRGFPADIDYNPHGGRDLDVQIAAHSAERETARCREGRAGAAPQRDTTTGSGAASGKAFPRADADPGADRTPEHQPCKPVRTGEHTSACTFGRTDDIS